MRPSVLVGCLVVVVIIAAAGFFNSMSVPQQVAVTTTRTATVHSTVTVLSAGSTGSLNELCFSPGGNCDRVVVNWIDRANVSVHVLIYSFTLDDVRDALIRAMARGVDVKVVMEKENAHESGSEYDTLKAAGVDIRLDSNPALMHDKVAVVDSHIILTGSYNWSWSATHSNNENLVVLDDHAWASAYELQFQSIYGAAST